MKAGCIPYYKDSLDRTWMYFMVPSDPHYGGCDPQIAKGNIDPGENFHDAAMREASEELGLRAVNIIHTIECGVYESLYLFAVEIDDPAAFDKPHYETGKTHWMTAKQFQNRGRGWQRSIVSNIQEQIDSYHQNI